jgi:hypothetical protein
MSNEKGGWWKVEAHFLFFVGDGAIIPLSTITFVTSDETKVIVEVSNLLIY